MQYQIMIQGTPNPNALKFVVSTPVKTEGNATYKSAAEAMDNPMAQALLGILHVSEVYFFDNYITVTQDGEADWDTLEEKVKIIILENIASHNPDFQFQTPVKNQPIALTDPELIKIDSIIAQSIRPYLQMDGGDLQVVSLDGNTLRVFYQGACGSCPSSAAGTLKSVEALLRDEYNPEITVELTEGL